MRLNLTSDTAWILSIPGPKPLTSQLGFQKTSSGNDSWELSEDRTLDSTPRCWDGATPSLQHHGQHPCHLHQGQGTHILCTPTAQCQGQCQNPPPPVLSWRWKPLFSSSAICKARNSLFLFLISCVVIYASGLFFCFSPSDCSTSGRLSGGIWLGKSISLG